MSNVQLDWTLWFISLLAVVQFMNEVHLLYSCINAFNLAGICKHRKRFIEKTKCMTAYTHTFTVFVFSLSYTSWFLTVYGSLLVWTHFLAIFSQVFFSNLFILITNIFFYNTCNYIHYLMNFLSRWVSSAATEGTLKHPSKRHVILCFINHCLFVLSKALKYVKVNVRFVIWCRL